MYNIAVSNCTGKLKMSHVLKEIGKMHKDVFIFVFLVNLYIHVYVFIYFVSVNLLYNLYIYLILFKIDHMGGR